VRGGASTGLAPGWRDLTRSQHRIAKGDAQLDMTFALSGGGYPGGAQPGAPAAPRSGAAGHGGGGAAGGPGGVGAGAGTAAAAAAAPHHVSDEPLSELSLCICLARRLPVQVLTRAVRSAFVPAEYPASLEALYGGTPDEAPPQFYTDPSVFRSLHEGMPDLAVPGWAASAEEFVRLHRCAGAGAVWGPLASVAGSSAAGGGGAGGTS
jgi:hypothetical protein